MIASTHQELLDFAFKNEIPNPEEWAVKNYIPYGKGNPHPQRHQLSRPWCEEARTVVGWDETERVIRGKR